jgi:hypothetical protein
MMEEEKGIVEGKLNKQKTVAFQFDVNEFCHPEPRLCEVRDLVLNTRCFASETYAQHDIPLLTFG